MMRFVLNILILAVCYIRLSGQCDLESDDNAGPLFKEITRNYFRGVRPSKDQFNVVTIGFEIALIGLISIDFAKQEFSVAAIVTYTWPDANIEWNPEMFSGVRKVQIIAEHLWVPDIVVYEERNLFSIEAEVGSTPLEVSHDGNVTMRRLMIITTDCKMKIRYYPFDEQECKLTFGSWNNDRNSLRFKASSDKVDTSAYSENGEWNLLETKILYGVQEEFDTRVVQFRFARRITYYLIKLVIPVLLIGLISSMAFTLPIESGEKLGHSVTTFLSITVYILVISDDLPPTSLEFPLVSSFTLLCLVASTVVIFLTLCVLTFSHVTSNETKPIPKFLRPLLLQYLPIIVLIKPWITEDPIDDEVSEDSLKHEEIEFSEIEQELDKDYQLRDFVMCEKLILQNISKMSAIIESKVTSDDESGHIKQEWLYLGKVLDRIVFIIYIIGFIILSILCIVGSSMRAF